MYKLITTCIFVRLKEGQILHYTKPAIDCLSVCLSVCLCLSVAVYLCACLCDRLTYREQTGSLIHVKLSLNLTNLKVRNLRILRFVIFDLLSQTATQSFCLLIDGNLNISSCGSASTPSMLEVILQLMCYVSATTTVGL